MNILERTFANEIKAAANGDGSRDYMFSMIQELRNVSVALEKRYEFNRCIKEHGRAKVALCIAVTMCNDAVRYEQPQLLWAHAIMELWTNRIERNISAAFIRGIHPAILADNSRELRMLTTNRI